MKIDPYKHKERYERWKEQVSSNNIPDITKENSDLILKYVRDMEHGINIAQGSIRGGRSFIRLNTLRHKLIFFAKKFKELYGLNSIAEIKEDELCKFFSLMKKGDIVKNNGGNFKSAGYYAKNFKAFWHWWMQINKKQGIEISDITIYMDTKEEKPRWVYLTEDQVKKLCEEAKYEYKVLMSFLFDSGIRAPTELINIRVSDLYNDCKELNIRDEVSKTFGRRIKLMLCSELLKGYIEKEGLKKEDYVFNIKPQTVNLYLKRLAGRIFGDKESLAGQKYSELTMYDFRHISCCYWLPRYKSESALKFRFGWKKSDKIHYYSEMLGMRDTIFPKKIKNDPYYLDFNGKLIRTIYAHGYPRIVESGFLDRIVSSMGNFNLSLHIEPMPLESTMILLNKEIQKQRADLYAAKIKNQLNPSLEIQHKDTLKILENLQKGEEKLFNISLYITCTADNKKQLDLLTKKVESELNSLLIIPRSADFQMLQGFKSCLPLCEDSINKKRNITTMGLSAFFPFTSSFFKFDETGIWFGLNKNKIPIIRDIFQLSNANGLCLATSGAGKSYLAKLFISRYLLNNTKVIVIDPQGEYRNLVKKFKGQRIDLSRESDTIINPLDLMGHSYPEKRLTLMDLMPIMLGELTEPQKSFIDRALTEIYENKGIYMNDPDSWNNTPPILGDLLKVLEKIEKHVTNLEKITLRSLINRLNIYVNGVFAFLNRHTKIDFKNKFICFDIGNLPRQIKPIMMFLVLDYVYTKMRDDLERKLLVVDEAWSLLSKTSEASYIFEIVKTCRKFNLGLLLINQEVEDMINSKAGRAVLANSSYTLLLKQKPAVINDIQKVFHLSNSERIALLTALVGEGILIMEDEHSNIKIVASDKEHELITTNADEILKNNSINEIKSKDVNIKVNDNDRFFRKKNLNQDEIKYLLRKGYIYFKHRGLRDRQKEEYIIKPRFNETPLHFFTIYNIANYLKNLGIEVNLFTTKKPDIVFNLGKKKYAIEVETGNMMDRFPETFEKRVKELKKNYNKWFFVVTDRNKLQKYKKFGESVDLRYLSALMRTFRRQISNSQ